MKQTQTAEETGREIMGAILFFFSLVLLLVGIGFALGFGVAQLF